MTRRRSRYHPPLPPSEAQHIADSYEPTGMTSEEIDAVFRCRHGHDLCASRCPDCTAEYDELRATMEYDEWKEEL